ncbi:MAG: hypothetical protein CM1200mP29_06440 [Verrucomicrobiota bacterium]|nr:MAG: hypothetical protein CM1200mP29_06440 [Verrucomicrobiota bacterium]
MLQTWCRTPFASWVYSGHYKAEKGNLLAWFLKVVRNGRLMPCANGGPNDEEAVAMLTANDSPPNIAVEQEELAGIMRRQLEAMPMAQREIVLLATFTT